MSKLDITVANANISLENNVISVLSTIMQRGSKKYGFGNTRRQTTV